MFDILIPVGILFGISLVCAVVLTLANKFFGVKEDETAVAIRDCLPGANCGACGYSGCDGYAKALSKKTCEKTNLCVPGGDGTAKEIANILGVAAEDVIEKVAYVACNGTCNAVQRKYEYQGQKTCHAANVAYNGDKFCTYACLGYGDCAAVCPQNAITVEDNLAHIDPRKCIGCGICVRACPNSIIRLINDTSRVVVECSNHAKGAQTRKYCSNGCIGCMKCQKACPHGAIQVINNLAVIDYSLCTGCGECEKVCPVHCIHEGNFICGAHN
jgi:RnfABCDGE-type electron transport complex B subunit